MDPLWSAHASLNVHLLTQETLFVSDNQTPAPVQVPHLDPCIWRVDPDQVALRHHIPLKPAQSGRERLQLNLDSKIYDMSTYPIIRINLWFRKMTNNYICKFHNYLHFSKKKLNMSGYLKEAAQRGVWPGYRLLAFRLLWLSFNKNEKYHPTNVHIDIVWSNG